MATVESSTVFQPLDLDPPADHSIDWGKRDFVSIPVKLGTNRHDGKYWARKVRSGSQSYWIWQGWLVAGLDYWQMTDEAPPPNVLVATVPQDQQAPVAFPPQALCKDPD
jgi:hypothetical protein